MILLQNRQRKITINTERLKKDAQYILDLLGYSEFDLGILITTNKSIKHYNSTYRNKNKPTDILSFPFHSNLEAGKTIEPESDDEKNLGDIIISAEYVASVVKEYKTTVDERMRVLLVHGVCHLLGYVHETDEEFAVMQKMENFLISKL